MVLAEQMGFSEFWIGEHHTHQWENIALPEAFIGKALALTDTIRLGTAPTCLPYHHPAHVATRLPSWITCHTAASTCVSARAASFRTWSYSESTTVSTAP